MPRLGVKCQVSYSLLVTIAKFFFLDKSLLHVTLYKGRSVIWARYEQEKENLCKLLVPISMKMWDQEAMPTCHALHIT